jgi:hypothetical protein
MASGCKSATVPMAMASPIELQLTLSLINRVDGTLDSPTVQCFDALGRVRSDTIVW